MDHIEQTQVLDLTSPSGLNDVEVKHRIDKGQRNTPPPPLTRTIPEILRDNIFTLFNFINLVLACLILYTGEYKNIFFLCIISTNMVIGIYQQIRTKNQIDKMSILSESKYEVIRNGKVVTIGQEDIVIDDLLIVRRGEQMPVDLVYLGDYPIEVDESQLTGEAAIVRKVKMDSIYSGSIIVSGKGEAQVANVGNETFVAKISTQVKREKRESSILLDTINKIIRNITFCIIPLGLLMYAVSFHKYGDVNAAILATCASILGMIPEGLLLLTTVTLGISAYKLSKDNVLVRSLAAIESLARIDVLCLDKTGTITSGNLKVKDFILTDSNYTKDQAAEMISNIVYAINDDNETALAIKDYYKQVSLKDVSNIVPFSSARKWSGIELGGNNSIFLGSPTFLIKDIDDSVSKQIEEYTKQGLRILALGQSSEKISTEPQNVKLIGFLLIEDEIRDDAIATFKFFEEQEVTLKVISGDNPVTVSNIARRAQIKGYEHFVDMNTVGVDVDYNELVKKYTIFGHVNPMQKKKLIIAYQDQGSIVGMTGDGVNDVLALQQADCSIAMANGSEAAKEIANFVLLNSNFSAMVQVLNEGRRVINNIQKIASVYLVKTLFSIILTATLILMRIGYPFEPIQLSPVSTFMIGIPTFFLALESQYTKIKESFFKRVLHVTTPAVVAALVSTYTLIFLNKIGIVNEIQEATLIILGVGAASFLVLLTIAKPYKKWKIILLSVMATLFLMTFTVPFLGHFFNLTSILNLYLFFIYVPQIALIIFIFQMTKRMVSCLNIK